MDPIDTAPPPCPLPADGAALADAFLLSPGRLYLDCAGHGPRLRTVQAAGEAALATSATRPWTRDWDGWLAASERVRARAAALFDGNADGVALVPSAGYGLSIAAANLPLRAGEAVLVLDGQFPSNLLPWQQRCVDTGARLHVVGHDGGWTGSVLAAIEQHPDVRIAALPQVYWRDGERLDLDAISAAAQARGITLVLDLSQSLGALPADIARWRPAFAVSVGYKWLLGPYGLSYLWASPEWRAQGRPLDHTWFNRQARADWRFPLDRPGDFLPGARRFDAGSVADTQRVAMAEAGLAQLATWGIDALSRQLGLRTQALRDALAERAVPMAWPAPAAPHIVGLRPPAAAWDGYVQALAQADIDVTARHGMLRIAPHLHVSVADMAGVAEVLAKVA